MNSKTTPYFSLRTFIFFLMLLVIPSTMDLFAQGTYTPQKLNFSMICAGESFNQYYASFGFSGFSPGETFKVQLSDSTGSFTSPTETTALAPFPTSPQVPPDSATFKTLYFAIPTNLVGSNNYQLRVISSTGVVNQQPFISAGNSKTFPAYYKAFNGSFSINNNQPNVSFCIGGSVTLAVYNPTPSVSGSSPANFPQLKYIWYKDNLPIGGQTSSSLSVNSAGVYYAKLDYGSCSDDNFRSQSVTVSSASGSGATITSSAGNPFCPSSNTTLTATSGNSYVWRKDNTVINGAISQTYQTNQAGLYTCDVDFGGCKSTGTIDLKVLTTNSSISGVDLDKVNYITEGETLTVSITTSTTAPTYKWFLNDVAISGADKSSLDITAQGNYKGTVSQTSGCAITDEFPFQVAYKVNLNVPKISNIVSPNGDGVNDTWIIPDKYLAGTKTHIMILNSLGEIVYQTDNYDNYNGWPQTTIEFNFNPVYYYVITPSGESVQKGSITLLK